MRKWNFVSSFFFHHNSLCIGMCTHFTMLVSSVLSKSEKHTEAGTLLDKFVFQRFSIANGKNTLPADGVWHVKNVGSLTDILMRMKFMTGYGIAWQCKWKQRWIACFYFLLSTILTTIHDANFNFIFGIQTNEWNFLIKLNLVNAKVCAYIYDAHEHHRVFSSAAIMMLLLPPS